MKKRTWIGLFVCLLLGELLGTNISSMYMLIFFNISGIFFIIYLRRCKKSLFCLHLFYFLFFLLGICSSLYYKNLEKTYLLNIQVGRESKIKVKVNDIRVQDNSIKIESEHIIVYLDRKYIKDEIDIGDEIEVFGQFEKLKEASNEASFSPKNYYNSRLIFIAFRGEYFKILKKSNNIFNSIRKNLIKKCLDIKNKKISGFIIAFTLGDKSYLDKEQYDLFKNNGIAHILAISGLHTSLLGLSIYNFLKKSLKFSYFISGLISSIILFLYLNLIIDGISVYRAIFMLIVLFISLYRGRSYDLLSILFFVASIVCFFNPFIYLQISFMLSFFSVFSLAISSEYIAKPLIYIFFSYYGYRKNNIIKNLIYYFITLVFMQIVSIPITVYYFNYIPIYSIIINIIVLSLLPILACSSFISLFVDIFYIKNFCLNNIKFIIIIYETICYFIDKFKYRILIARFDMAKYILYYFSIGVFILIINFKFKDRSLESIKKRKKYIYRYCMYICILLLILFGILFLKNNKYNEIDFFDVGQGDGIYLNICGNDILIDFGSSNNEKLYENTLRPFLLSRGIKDIEYAFITHAHKDHYSAILKLIEEGEIKVKKLYLPKVLDKKQKNISKIAGYKNIDLEYIISGEKISINDANFTCISPMEALKTNDTNENSIVLLYEIYGYKFLFTGDMTMFNEKLVLKNNKFNKLIEDIDILKVAHHGSYGSSSIDFLYKLSPEYAIISYAKFNRYGHPHKETIKRLKSLDIDILETAVQGQIKVKIKKNKFLIESFKK